MAKYSLKSHLDSYPPYDLTKYFSHSGQNNFGNKIPFLLDLTKNSTEKTFSLIAFTKSTEIVKSYSHSESVKMIFELLNRSFCKQQQTKYDCRPMRLRLPADLVQPKNDGDLIANL